jgi:hypothetical protein
VTCIRNDSHKKTDTVCAECLKEFSTEPSFPDLNKINPELRAVLTQLTVQNTDLNKCWKSSYSNLTVLNRRLKIENVYYAFFKADIGNSTLKRKCGTIGCVNPYHHVSRFDPTDINQYIRAGFNRTLKNIQDLPTGDWLRLP